MGGVSGGEGRGRGGTIVMSGCLGVCGLWVEDENEIDT